MEIAPLTFSGMADRVPKDALYEALAGVAKALASGRRAEIVDLLAQGERSVDEIAGQIDQSLANTSHHLRTLASAGLLHARREGTRIFYRLASAEVGELWIAVRRVAIEHVTAVEGLAAAYLGDREGLEPVGRADLVARLATGDVVVLDVRPAREFAAAHVAGATSVPIAELERRLDALPRDIEIVAYCRGPFCVYADDAVRLLRGRGFCARRLEDGFPEWRQAGLPIAVGEGGSG